MARSPRRALERVPPPLYFVACLFAGWALGLVWPLPLGLTRTSHQLLVALLDSWWVLAFVPVLAFALDRYIIPGEEDRLRQAFGERYDAYASKVRRWL